MGIELSRDSKEFFDYLIGQLLMIKRKDVSLPPYYLPVLPGGFYRLPPELRDLEFLLMEARYNSRQKIEVSYDREITETSFGGFSAKDYHDTVYEGEGILLGEKIIHDSGDVYDYFRCGFKLWLLSGDMLGLHLFYHESQTYGRISGLGYTGYEETRSVYEAPLRKVARVRKNAISLESEIRGKITEVEDVKRVEYSLPTGNDTEFHILDWNEDKKEWTNSYRHSFGVHKWHSCPMDEYATEQLKQELKPVTVKLGVKPSTSNVRELVEASTKSGRGFLGKYREGLYRNRYPGEIERGEIPSINVDVYQKQDGTIILLKEGSFP